MAKQGRAVGQQFFVQLAKRLGVPRQYWPNAVRFFRAQQAGEGTQATWNPLATTRSLHMGETSFNSVGVKNYPNRRVGLAATVQTYKLPYYTGILSDLRRGVPAERIANNRLSELETWGTGSRVAASLGSIPMPQIPATPTSVDPRQPLARRAGAISDRDRREFIIQLLMLRSSGASMRMVLPLLLTQLYEARTGRDLPQELNVRPVAPAPGPTGPVAGSVGGKRGLRLPQTFTATHQTDGLPGYPAYDFMAAARTPVGAPDDGTIIRLSGRNTWSGGFGGRSIYLKTKRGVFFLTHLSPDVRVRVGQKIRKGQLIGYVGDPTSSMAPHVHAGFNAF